MGTLFFSAVVLLCSIGVTLSYPYLQDKMRDYRYWYPYIPERVAEAQGSELQTEESYRLLHHHCDDRFSLNPRIRYFLKMPQPQDDRWGVSTCSTCDYTTIQFSAASSTTGDTIKSGDRVMVVAPNGVILKCDSSKCPKQNSRYVFEIYKCDSAIGDPIDIEDMVMLYTTYNGKECQVSFNRADPFLWCPGTPLNKPPTRDECYNSCGTGVYVLPE